MITDYAVNLELIMSKISVNNGCLKRVAYISSSKPQAMLIMAATNFSSLLQKQHSCHTVTIVTTNAILP